MQEDQEWLLCGQSEEGDKTDMASPRFVEMLRDSGVSGTEFWKVDDGVDVSDKEFPLVASIKCLHAHYAHYRSQIGSLDGRNMSDSNDEGINIVGEMVHDILLEEYDGIDFL